MSQASRARTTALSEVRDSPMPTEYPFRGRTPHGERCRRVGRHGSPGPHPHAPDPPGAGGTGERRDQRLPGAGGGAQVAAGHAVRREVAIQPRRRPAVRVRLPGEGTQPVPVPVLHDRVGREREPEASELGAPAQLDVLEAGPYFSRQPPSRRSTSVRIARLALAVAGRKCCTIGSRRGRRSGRQARVTASLSARRRAGRRRDPLPAPRPGRPATRERARRHRRSTRAETRRRTCPDVAGVRRTAAPRRPRPARPGSRPANGRRGARVPSVLRLSTTSSSHGPS